MIKLVESIFCRFLTRYNSLCIISSFLLGGTCRNQMIPAHACFSMRTSLLKSASKVTTTAFSFAAKRRMVMSWVLDGLLSISYPAWNSALLKTFGIFSSIQNFMRQCVLEYSYHERIHEQSRMLREFSLASADLDIAQADSR